jgi:hypothetical protein
LAGITNNGTAIYGQFNGMLDAGYGIAELPAF